MLTKKKIENFLNDLNPEQRQLAQDHLHHLSSMGGTQEVQGEELKTTLQEKYLTPSYIDDLIQKNNLEKWSIKQLNTIKSLLAEHNAKIDPNRLTIKNNLVCIDGFTIPAKEEDRKTQYYKEMKKNPEGLTYPGYAKALLNFSAEITKTQFTFPANRDALQKGEIDDKSFYEEINTPANEAIIKTLHDIVWFNSVIPVGLNNDKYVIYAVVRSGYYFFDRNGISDDSDCLVSAA